MKKSLKKILQMVMIVAVLCPSIGIAEEQSDNALSDVMKWGGGAVTLVGIWAWSEAKDEAAECRKIGHTISEGINGRACINQSDLDDAETLKGALTLVGAGMAIVGFVIDKDGVFQVRPIRNGFAIEHDGFSFSAAATGKVKLQKRWEF